MVNLELDLSPVHAITPSNETMNTTFAHHEWSLERGKETSSTFAQQMINTSQHSEEDTTKFNCARQKSRRGIWDS